MSCIVVFGSAVNAASNGVIPHDVDIMIEGNDPFVSEVLVLAHSFRNDLCRNRTDIDMGMLPFDFHKGIIRSVDGKLHCWLPSALDVPAQYRVIGDEEVEIHSQKFTGIASVLRALGDNPQACVDHIVERAKGGWLNWWEVGVAPKRDNQNPKWGDWDGYCQGVTALRSAIRHCQWREIKKGLGAFGEFLDHLVHQDPKVVPQYLEDGSPDCGQGVEIDAWIEWTDRQGHNHWRFSVEYLRGHQPFTLKQISDLLWPPK